MNSASLRECAALLDARADAERRDCSGHRRMCPWHRWRHDALVEAATDLRTAAIRLDQDASKTRKHLTTDSVNKEKSDG